jgi:3-hydroxyisobutyrate dehydrogenase-like beta-hydroxyacid dehydrogenase
MNPVGIVGVGAMGSAFVERFHKAGLQTVVYDVSQAAMDAAVAQGAQAANSPADVARKSEITGVMVLNDEQVLDSVLGKDGVLEGMSPDKILLLHSTIHPRTTRKVAEFAREHGVQVADACITGRPWVVRAGDAVCILGAPDELVPTIEPHLRHLAKVVFHMGPVGCGNSAKIVKNMITASERLVIGEGLRVAEAAGISYVKLLELMRAAEHEPVVEKWEESFDPSGASSTPVGSQVLFEKDVPLAEELAKDLGVEAPIIRELAAAGRKLDNPPHG